MRCPKVLNVTTVSLNRDNDCTIVNCKFIMSGFVILVVNCYDNRRDL